MLTELIIYPIFLIVHDPVIKLMLTGLLGLFNSGWYSILKANAYSALPGKPGTVMALYNIITVPAALIPFALGMTAHFLDLQIMMWFLMIDPVLLLAGLTRISHDK